jgi:hypothetical protein
MHARSYHTDIVLRDDSDPRKQWNPETNQVIDITRDLNLLKLFYFSRFNREPTREEVIEICERETGMAPVFDLSEETQDAEIIPFPQLPEGRTNGEETK